MKKIITIITITALFLNPNWANAVATELESMSLRSDGNLVAYYRMEDATDELGSYDLTNNNSVAFNSAKFNNGADFGSSDGDKTLDKTSGVFTLAGDMTISFWWKLSAEPSTNTLQRIVWNYSGNTGSGQGMANIIEYKDVSGTKKLGFLSGGNWAFVDYITTLGTVNWYHIALVRDGDDFTGYLNGSSVVGPITNTTTDAGFATSQIRLGGQATASNNALGIIDDVSIFDRALTPSEISDIYGWC